MHSFNIESDARVFVGTFSGSTSLGDLTSGLRLCVDASIHHTRAIWDARELKVNFTHKEVLELVRWVHRAPLGEGKMAFVVESTGFLYSLIRLVRKYPGNWRTEWKVFDHIDDARNWVVS